MSKEAGSVIRLQQVAYVEISGVDKKWSEKEREVRLCNFVDVYYNWAVTRRNSADFMRATANDNEIERFTLKKGQVALTKDSETKYDIGISTYIADDLDNTILGYHCALITPDEKKVNGKYLNAFLHTKFIQRYFELNATGSGQRYALSIDTLNNIPLYLPPVEVQKKIGDLFSKIDRKIELNREINDSLEKMAKSIYNYWFVQYDFPDASGLPYRSSGGAMVWNKKIGQEIPINWKAGNMYTIAQFFNGLACQKFRGTDEEDKIPVIKIKEMHDGITGDTETVSANIPEKNKISDGDILFSWSATLEVAYWFGGNGALNQHIFKVIERPPFSKEYVYEQLSSYIGNFAKIAEARKTTMGHITSDHLNDSCIVLPPEEVIGLFTEQVRPIHQKIKSLNKESQELIKIRSWLLPMLTSCQVSITD